MRLTSALFVAAHLRRCYAEGASAVVVRRGAEEAGAIFFLVDRLDDTIDLYGPAPQTAFSDSDRPADRLFQLIAAGKPTEEVNRRLERETRFDSDLWVVAIEDRQGRSFLDLAPD
jgi:hypothetical protein